MLHGVRALRFLAAVVVGMAPPLLLVRVVTGVFEAQSGGEPQPFDWWPALGESALWSTANVGLLLAALFVLSLVFPDLTFHRSGKWLLVLGASAMTGLVSGVLYSSVSSGGVDAAVLMYCLFSFSTLLSSGFVASVALKAGTAPARPGTGNEAAG
ncbi:MULTISPECIES: hypothetical protein [unclassified Streptomyces]|uniref:hypothetical protein n=1 Tax=unclassified Streptomyces TaxID=2593676 RepID=UPI00382DE9BA